MRWHSNVCRFETIRLWGVGLKCVFVKGVAHSDAYRDVGLDLTQQFSSALWSISADFHLIYSSSLQFKCFYFTPTAHISFVFSGIKKLFHQNLLIKPTVCDLRAELGKQSRATKRWKHVVWFCLRHVSAGRKHVWSHLYMHADLSAVCGLQTAHLCAHLQQLSRQVLTGLCASYQLWFHRNMLTFHRIHDRLLLVLNTQIM